MRIVVHNQPWRSSRCSGMTLLEIMVAVTIMTFIMLGLFSMFDRTQQALLEGRTQVDILQTARITSEMQARELKQIRPLGIEGMTNVWIGPSPTTVPLTNVLNDGVTISTNVLQQLFFVSKQAEWRSIGYLIGVNPPGTAEDLVLYTNGVGALYRYERRTPLLDVELVGTNLFDIYENCRNDPNCIATNFHLVAQGVVSFRVKAYGTNGLLVNTNLSWTNVWTGAQVPANLEVELGVLETAAYERIRALALPGNTNLSRGLLATNYSGQIHMFRQRVPIRAQL